MATCKEDRASGQSFWLKNNVVVLPEIVKQCGEWQIILEDLSKGQLIRYHFPMKIYGHLRF